VGTIQSGLAALAVLAAVLAIRAHYLDDGRRWQIYLFKPLATLLILALALSLPAARADYARLIAAGLLLSTAGDVFLMLPRDRFVAGLASFLVAHLCYVWAFSTDAPFGAAPLLWPPYFAAGGLVVALVWPGLKPALRAPVLVYVIVIAAMAGQATGRWQATGGGGGAAGGARRRAVRGLGCGAGDRPLPLALPRRAGGDAGDLLSCAEE
jgi:uncharacterized membrane protein YhhN